MTRADLVDRVIEFLAKVQDLDEVQLEIHTKDRKMGVFGTICVTGESDCGYARSCIMNAG
jgi:hypothetical protein